MWFAEPSIDLSSIQVDPEWEKAGFKQKSVLLLKNLKGQQYTGSAHIAILRYGPNSKIHAKALTLSSLKIGPYLR